MNDKKLALEASFSPDSQFVFSGSSDGKVHAWNAETGHRVNNFAFLLSIIYFNLCFLLLLGLCIYFGSYRTSAVCSIQP